MEKRRRLAMLMALVLCCTNIMSALPVLGDDIWDDSDWESGSFEESEADVSDDVEWDDSWEESDYAEESGEWEEASDHEETPDEWEPASEEILYEAPDEREPDNEVPEEEFGEEGFEAPDMTEVASEGTDSSEVYVAEADLCEAEETELWFDDLRGEGYTWFYDNESCAHLTASVNVPEGKNWTIEWKVGRDLDRSGQVAQGTELQEGTYYAIDADRMGITFNVPALSDYDDQHGGDVDFAVEAKLSGPELQSSESGCSFFLTYAEYHYNLPGMDPGDRQYMPGTNYWIDRKRDVFVWDEDHNNGWGNGCGDRFELIDVAITEQVWDPNTGDWRNVFDSEREQVARFEPKQEGWSIDLTGMGRLIVEYDYIPLKRDSSEVQHGSFEIIIGDEKYQLDWSYPSENNNHTLGFNSEMIVGSTLTRAWLNEYGWYFDDPVSDYRLAVGKDNASFLAEISITEDGKSVLISSKEHEGNDSVVIDVLVPDDNENEITVGSFLLYYSVYQSYTTIEPGALINSDGSRLNVRYGEAIDFKKFAPKVYCHETDGTYEMEDVTFHLDYDSTQWEAVSAAEPLKLIRRTANETYVNLIAEVPDESGALFEVCRQYYKFDSLNYEPRFLYSYDGKAIDSYQHILAGDDTPLEVSLDLSELSETELDAVSVEWSLVCCDENGEREPKAATMQIAKDGKSVTIWGKEEYAFSQEDYFDLRARVCLGDREIAWLTETLHTWHKLLLLADFNNGYDNRMDLMIPDPIIFEDRMIRLMLLDEAHPGGVFEYAKIVSWKIADSKIIDFEESGNDLLLCPKNCGNTSMTLTVSNDELFGKGVTRNLTIDYIEVTDSDIEFRLASDTGQFDMLPNDELKLSAQVFYWHYDYDAKEYISEPLTADQYMLTLENLNPDIASVDQDGTIRSHNQNGFITLHYNLKYNKKTYNFYYGISVQSIYYYLETDELKDPVAAGAELPLNPRIIRRSTKDKAGTVYKPAKINWSLEEYWTSYFELRDGKVYVKKDAELSGTNPVDAGFSLNATYMTRDFGEVTSSKSVGVRIAPSTDLSKAEVTLSKTSYTYTGSARKPDVTVKVGDKILVKDQDYTVSYSNNVNAGTASVTVRGMGSSVGEKTVTFAISKASPVLEFPISSLSVKYGEASFAALLKTKKTDGTITFKSSKTSVATVNSTSGKVTIKGLGTATITATAAAGNNYKSGSTSFKLVVSKGSNTITASDITKVTSTSSRTVSIGAKAKASTTLTYKSSNSSIKVSSKGVVTIPKNFVGSTTITITGASTSKYNSCTKKITVTVNPKPAALKALTNLSGRKLQIEWNRNSAVTGYQIMYSKSSTFKSPTTVTISNNSTVKYLLSSGLTKGSTYYVKIRTYKTVNSKKYYSTWSSSLYKKISK